MTSKPSASVDIKQKAMELHRKHFGTFGRLHETPAAEMTGEEKEAFDLISGARGMVPGPYKIWVRNLKLAQVMVPLGKHYQAQHTLSKGEIEIAVLLTTGSWMAAYASYEHEWLSQLLGGLPEDKVAALVAGLHTSFEDERQQVVYDMASALLAPRIVPVRLYERAVEALGHDGLTDLIAFIGYFTTVALTLRAYDVPSEAIGLNDRK